jgi:hypothetical protein
MFRPLGAIFRGSTVKGTKFTIAKDFSTISYTGRSLEIRCKEHTRSIRKNEERAAIVTPVLKSKHQYGKVDDIGKLRRKREMGNIRIKENFYIYLYKESNLLIL